MNSGAFTWENFRRKDGTLDLLAALMDRAPAYPNPVRVKQATDFIDEVEDFCPIRSRQAAALTLTQALRILRGE